MLGNRNMVGCQMYRQDGLPDNWQCLPLAERIVLEYGSALKKEDRVNGEFPVFGSNGIVGFHNRALVNGPGIIVGRKGSIGMVHYSAKSFWPIDTAYYVKPLADDDFRYIHYLLHHLDLQRLNAATGVPGLSRRDTMALLGAFPPPDEQRAIADILDAVDAAIERTRTAIQKAQRLEKGLLEDLVTKRARAWPAQRFDAVAEVGSGVTLGRDLSGSPTVTLPYLRVENVQAGFIDLTEIKQVKVRPDEVERYLLRAGDVLMTEGGDFDKLGRGGVWHGEIDPCLHQNHVFRVRPNKDILDSDFLEAVICSSYGKSFFQRIAKRTTNLASINKTQLRAFRVPCPPITEQRQIAAVLRAASEKIEAINKKLAALERLKRGLMQDLLTGKVRVDVNKAAGTKTMAKLQPA